MQQLTDSYVAGRLYSGVNRSKPPARLNTYYRLRCHKLGVSVGKLVKVVGVVVVLLVGGKIAQKVASNQLDSSADVQVTEAVAAINAQLPKDLGSGVTLTKAEVVGKTVRNTYTIAPSAPFDPGNRPALEATAVAQVCGAMAPMAKQGFTIDFRYEYTASGSPRTLDISVPPSKCA